MPELDWKPQINERVMKRSNYKGVPRVTAYEKNEGHVKDKLFSRRSHCEKMTHALKGGVIKCYVGGYNRNEPEERERDGRFLEVWVRSETGGAREANHYATSVSLRNTGNVRLYGFEPPVRTRAKLYVHAKENVEVEVEAFEPSQTLAKFLLLLVTKKHLYLNQQVEQYKESLSEGELSNFKLLTEELSSPFNSYSVDTSSAQIKKAVQGLLGTIARSQSILSENTYTLTENNQLNDDVHDALADRLLLRPREATLFLNKLHGELRSSSIHNNIGGKWGRLSYQFGELVMDIKLKNKIEQRAWTKATTKVK